MADRGVTYALKLDPDPNAPRTMADFVAIHKNADAQIVASSERRVESIVATEQKAAAAAEKVGASVMTAGRGLVSLGTGIAHIGLASSGSVEKMIAGLAKIQGVVQIGQGLFDIVRGLHHATKAYGEVSAIASAAATVGARVATAATAQEAAVVAGLASAHGAVGIAAGVAGTAKAAASVTSTVILEGEIIATRGVSLAIAEQIRATLALTVARGALLAPTQGLLTAGTAMIAQSRVLTASLGQQAAATTALTVARVGAGRAAVGGVAAGGAAAAAGGAGGAVAAGAGGGLLFTLIGGIKAAVVAAVTPATVSAAVVAGIVAAPSLLALRSERRDASERGELTKRLQAARDEANAGRAIQEGLGGIRAAGLFAGSNAAERRADVGLGQAEGTRGQFAAIEAATRLAELHKRDAELVRGSAAEREAADAESTRLAERLIGLAEQRKSLERQIAQDAREASVERQNAARDELRSVHERISATREGLASAAERFAALDPLQQSRAIAASRQARSAGATSLSDDQRKLLRSVGTREAVGAARTADLAEAQAAGFDTFFGGAERRDIARDSASARGLDVRVQTEQRVQANIQIDEERLVRSATESIMRLTQDQETRIQRRIQASVDSLRLELANKARSEMVAGNAARGGR